MSKEKGARWERNYRNVFNADGEDDAAIVDRFAIDVGLLRPFFAMRVPSSGSATTDALPDLHIWFVPDEPRPEIRQYAAEVKAGDERVHFGKVDDLDEYCDRTGAIPIAIVHLDRVGDFVFRKDELHQTDAGNYTVTKARDADGARTFADFVGSPFF